MEPKQVTEYIRAVGEGLKPLADSITGGGKQLLEYAIWHNYAVALGDVMAFAVMLPLAWKVCQYCKWGSTVTTDGDGRRPSSPFSRSEGKFALGIVLGIISGTLTLVSGISLFYDAIPRLIAPEWSAISDILSGLHK